MKMQRPITLLILALSVVTAYAAETDFKKLYSAFGEIPPAEIRPIAEKLVGATLRDFELNAENVDEAYEKINTALQGSDYSNGLSLIKKNADAKNYQSPIKIPKATRSLGEAINLLCEQANLVWDFSAFKLTFTPNMAEPGVGLKRVPR